MGVGRGIDAMSFGSGRCDESHALGLVASPTTQIVSFGMQNRWTLTVHESNLFPCESSLLLSP